MGLILDVLPVMLILLVVWKMDIVWAEGYNDNYLSQNTSKMIRGIMAVVIVLHHLAQRTQAGGIQSLHLFRTYCCYDVLLLFRIWNAKTAYKQ